MSEAEWPIVGRMGILYVGGADRYLVVREGLGGADPVINYEPGGLLFRWGNGKELFIPWVHIHEAEFKPVSE